jgi:hypothetical protein
MAYKQVGLLDRSLTDEEVEEFKQWARDNFKPGKPAETLWHPVIMREWERLQAEVLSHNGELGRSMSIEEYVEARLAMLTRHTEEDKKRDQEKEELRKMCGHKYSDGRDATYGEPVSGDRRCGYCYTYVN